VEQSAVPLCNCKLQQASSSIGRASVSKTEGWGFETLLACQIQQLTSGKAG
jgi:hypothetical protein